MYRCVAAQSNSTIDDEFIETLSFELPEGTDQFSLRDGNLIQLKAFYRQSGAWPANFPDAEMVGTISGNLNTGSGRWSVIIDIAMQRDGQTYATIQTNGVLEPQ